MKRFVTLLALLALVAGPSAAPAGAFYGAKTDVAAGSYPFALAVGDLDGDGKPDLAVTNYGANALSVLTGAGAGAFGANAAVPAGAGPTQVAIGDFNGDGHPDLAIANRWASTVSVLLGAGGGAFGPRTDFATGSQPVALAVADLDGDGHLDLVVANSGAASVSLLRGNGSGSFGARTDVATASTPTSVAVGDLDGDGVPDLAVACGAGVSVLRGLGGGAFGARTDYATGLLPMGVAIADLDGDGRRDLAVVNFGSNTVSVLPGTGGGLFGPRTDHATGGNPTAVAIGRLDGDAHPDLVVANSSSNTVSVLFGGGAFAFSPKQDYPAGTGPFAVAIADVNADGRPDLVTASFGASSVSVLLWQPAPSAVAMSTSPNPSIAGGAVTFTATVTPAGATGTVAFRDGADTLGTATLAGGVAVLSTPALTVGAHILTAAFGGDSLIAASVSLPAYHTVLSIDPTTLALDASPNPAVVGQKVWLTASVTPPAAAGSVEFRDGASVLGTVALDGGDAVLALPSLPLGSHSLTAVYAGDPRHHGSSSPVVVLAVHPAPTLVTLGSSPNPSRLGEGVSFTATVKDSADTSLVVPGSVQFTIDSVAVGAPVTLANGVATLAGIADLTVGAHHVTAAFSGSTGFLPGLSPALTHQVASPRPSIAWVRDVPSDQGGQVNVRWNASNLDAAPGNGINSYWILRSAPAAFVARARRTGARITSVAAGSPVQALSLDARVGAILAIPYQGETYFWEFVASTPATQAAAYTFTAATTCDSLAGSNPFTAFMIMARATDDSQWWFSDPDSGYSVDNLAPSSPAAFAGAYGAGVTALHWSASADADVAGYRLYRGASAGFVPAADNLVAATSDTTLADASGAPAWYKLCAVDTHGNASTYDALLPVSTADVADAAARVFSLEGARPNPSRGERLTVAFTLPVAGAARLELVDVSGRRVAALDVSALGAGRHTLALAPERRLAPGVYLLRLVQGANVRVSRVAVLD